MLRRFDKDDEELDRLNELLEMVYNALNDKRYNNAEKVEEAKFLIRQNTDSVMVSK